MDPLKKAKDIDVRNEAIWDNIASKLGFGGKTPAPSGVVKSLGGGRYSINGNLVEKLAGVTEQELMSYDWVNGKLSFLKDGRWVAKELSLQMSSGVEAVKLFYGALVKGTFVGNFFGDFQGDSFQGRFMSSYKSYGSDPSTFVDGSVADYKDGVLGVDKLDNIALDKTSTKDRVSLLELKVGQYCNMVDDNGVTHSFQMTKCCDGNDMNIELQEQTGQKNGIRLLWSDIRKGNDPTRFRQLSSIRIGSKPRIPYLFANDRVGNIVSIEVSSKPTLFGVTTDTYKPDMALLRPLQYPLPTATVHLFTPDEVSRYGKIYRELANNGMQHHLRNLLDGIKLGVITGWNGYPHLASIFNNEKGQPVKLQKYADSLKWLDEFVEVFVLRMMRSRTMGGTYMNNEKGRSIIMSQIHNMVSSVMGNQKVAQPTPVAKSRPAPKNSIIPEVFERIDRLIEGDMEQNAGETRKIG